MSLRKVLLHIISEMAMYFILLFEKTEALIDDLIAAAVSGDSQGSIPLDESLVSGCNQATELSLEVTCKNGHTVSCTSSPCDFHLCFEPEFVPTSCLDAYRNGFTDSGFYNLQAGRVYCDFEVIIPSFD